VGGGGQKFLADAMLGRLATWLRALGMDVLYERDIEDDDLIELALEGDRIVLTRDTLLVKRRSLRGRVFLVHGDRFEDQVREVSARFGIERERFFTRCLRCNVPLEAIEKKAARGRVPPYVFGPQESFSSCPECGRIYWPGTHRAQMERKIEEMLGNG